jgi:hypothetical protein
VSSGHVHGELPQLVIVSGFRHTIALLGLPAGREMYQD